MAKPEYLSKSDTEYYRSGRWICKASPTNAHHWVEAPSIAHGLFVCKYCGDSKRFPIVYNPYNTND